MKRRALTGRRIRAFGSMLDISGNAFQLSNMIDVVFSGDSVTTIMLSDNTTRSVLTTDLMRKLYDWSCPSCRGMVYQDESDGSIFCPECDRDMDL